MKRVLLVMLLLVICLAGFAQKKRKLMQPPPPPPTAAQQKIIDYHDDCVHRDTYTAKQRLKFYPFNKATQVILASFYGPLPNMEPTDTAGVYRPVHGLKLPGVDTVGKLKDPFNSKKVDYSAFMEQITLTQSQVTKLTDIFYNIGIRNTPLPPGVLETADPGASCFNPRNAILFVNAKGDTFAYIEICFECERFVLYPEKIKMWDWCDDKWTLIRNYFAARGIRWGAIFLNRRTYKHKKVDRIKI